MNINIEAMTQAERQAAFSELMKLFVGAIRFDNEHYDWCLPLASEVIFPDQIGVVTQCPHIDFAPKKLVIFETLQEQILFDEIASFKNVRGKEVLEEIRRVEHRQTVLLPRSAWRVETLLVGNRLQMPSASGIDGALFGSDGPISFIDECSCALSISLCVRNMTKTPAKFSGVILGNTARKALKAI